MVLVMSMSPDHIQWQIPILYGNSIPPASCNGVIARLDLASRWPWMDLVMSISVLTRIYWVHLSIS